MLSGESHFFTRNSEKRNSELFCPMPNAQCPMPNAPDSFLFW
ncbi:hypothetical protein [Nostoc sp.]